MILVLFDVLISLMKVGIFGFLLESNKENKEYDT